MSIKVNTSNLGRVLMNILSHFTDEEMKEFCILMSPVSYIFVEWSTNRQKIAEAFSFVLNGSKKQQASYAQLIQRSLNCLIEDNKLSLDPRDCS